MVSFLRTILKSSSITNQIDSKVLIHDEDDENDENDENDEDDENDENEWTSLI